MSHNIEAMVSRQVRRWESAQKAKEPESRRRPPSVALSRLPHAGGEEVAECVAAKLGWATFGREIIDRIEQEHGLQRDLLAALDERMRGMVDRYLKDAVRKEKLTENDYLRHIIATIRTLGEGGMAVILGRGAPFILPADRTLRVLVVAPDAFRAERLAEAEGLSIERAREELSNQDEQRRYFLRQQFDVAQEDARLYDLVVNTATLNTETAANLVIDALRSRFPDALEEAAAS